MNLALVRCVLSLVFAFLFLFAESSQANTKKESWEQNKEEQYLSLYLGQAATDRLMHILGRVSTDWLDSYLISGAYGRTLYQRPYWRLEGEKQMGVHFGEQNHAEFVGSLIFRWKKFPWDDWVDTRVALGEGLSWATKEPPIEPRGDREGGDSAQLLNYLMLEAEAKRPDSAWSGYVRIHHRSGAAGTFGNVKGGSNFIGVGVRYYLQ